MCSGRIGNFTTTSCNVGGSASATNLCTLQDFGTSGGGVGVDAEGNVYIADTGNNRVLQFNAPFTAGVTPVNTSFSANGVFGQTTFTSNTGSRLIRLQNAGRAGDANSIPAATSTSST